MMTSTRDPITGFNIPDPEHHPFVIEGQGTAALKIYFESEQSKQAYLDAAYEEHWDEQI